MKIDLIFEDYDIKNLNILDANDSNKAENKTLKNYNKQELDIMAKLDSLQKQNEISFKQN